METHHLQIRVYGSLDGLQELIPAWQELLAAVPTATVFSTWEWLSAWWRSFGHGRELLVLAFFDGGSRLVGLAPLSLETCAASAGLQLRLIRLMGDGSEDSDNLDVLALPGREGDVAKALLHYFGRARELWDVAQFNTLPSDSPTANALLDQLKQRRWTHCNYPQPGTVIDLPVDWDTYRQRLSYNERGQLGKYMRRLERKHQVRLYKCTDPNDLDARLQAFFQLHQKRWRQLGSPGTFANEARRQFYRELARVFLSRGWLEFWTLDLDDRPVAGEFNFRYRDTVYSLQVGFDPDYTADRVGYALRGHLLQQFIAAGVRHYDFLAGEGGYKERWAGRTSYYNNLHFAMPYTRGSAYLRLRRRAGTSKEWLRAHLPSRAWSTLRWVSAKVREKPSIPAGTEAVHNDSLSTKDPSSHRDH